MKIILLTLSYPIKSQDNNIYKDLVKELIENGIQVFVVCPIERRFKTNTYIENNGLETILRVKSGNFRETKNYIEKWLSMIHLQYNIINEIKKHLKSDKIPLVLYSTPPITFINVIKYIKKKYKTVSYLMLKDIFPQNAVDLQIIRKNSFIWKYFRKREKQLYQVSDKIGCMSPANIEYVKKENVFIESKKFELFPNTMKLNIKKKKINKYKIKTKHNIPNDKILIILGGNIGLPQGISYLKEILHYYKYNKKIHFIIVGRGTEFKSVKRFTLENEILNVTIINYLDTCDFDDLVSCADIGLILLDVKFTIPNFPSRLLPLLEAGKPIIAATDINTDLGGILEKNKCGFKVPHGNIVIFDKKLRILVDNLKIRKLMGLNARLLLKREYTTRKSYKILKKYFY